VLPQSDSHCGLVQSYLSLTVIVNVQSYSLTSVLQSLQLRTVLPQSYSHCGLVQSYLSLTVIAA